MEIPEPNPRRVGACPGCGLYRLDGRHPYLHRAGCPDEGDLQIDRFLAETRAGDPGGPTLYETDADVEQARRLGVRDAATYDDAGLLTSVPAAAGAHGRRPGLSRSRGRRGGPC